MTGVLFDFGTDPALFERLADSLDVIPGVMVRRQFPDGDTYLRFTTDCRAQSVYLLCSLDRPDSKVLPLLLAADTLRSLGAKQVVLIAPYLAYMRQDKIFAPGEGINAQYFGRLISAYFDGLVTVDPHLHRIHSLAEVYAIPAVVASAAPAIAAWIRAEVSQPVLIGPDSESAQWVTDIAVRAGAPYLVLEKIRSGDRQVSVSVPDLHAYPESVPVLVDDIISTGETMIAALSHVCGLAGQPPLCVAIHGVFADSTTARKLHTAGAASVVTTNTITHSSNVIDISAALADGCRKLHAIMAAKSTAQS